MGYKKLGLEKAIDKQLDVIAKPYNLTLHETVNSLKFKELIVKLSKKAQVAIIIDEYDRPIIDYMDNIPVYSFSQNTLTSSTTGQLSITWIISHRPMKTVKF